MQGDFAKLLERRMHELDLKPAEFGRRLRTSRKPHGVTGEAVSNWLKGSRPTQIPPDVIAEALVLPAGDVRAALGLHNDALSDSDRIERSQTRLIDLVSRIPLQDLQQLCDFAEFLASRRVRAEWSRFGLEMLARAYGDDEPEYTLADAIR